MQRINSPEMALRFSENADGGYFRNNEKYNYLISLIPTADTTHSTSSMDGFTVPIAPLSSLQRVLRIEEDYNFHLLGAKFSAYYLDRGVFYFYENVIQNTNEALDTKDIQILKGTPYERYLKITLSVTGNKYIYGGPSFSSNNAGQYTSISLSTLQGVSAEGYGQIKTPYLVPRQGTITAQIFNTHATKMLKVAGFLYGEKVRV